MALHPARFAWPLPLPETPVGSYPTISTITCVSHLASEMRGHRLECFLLHVLSSREREAPDVIGARRPVVFGLSSPQRVRSDDPTGTQSGS